MTARTSSPTESERADARAREFRATVRQWMASRQPELLTPWPQDAAWDFCAANPGGPLHAGNLDHRAAALLQELTALVEYIATAPDRGHPMERLSAEPEFRAWFDRDDDAPPPPLPDRER